MDFGLRTWLRWHSLRSIVAQRLRDAHGQTTMEYILVISAVAMLAAAAIFSFGGAVKGSLCHSITALNGSTGC